MPDPCLRRSSLKCYSCWISSCWLLSYLLPNSSVALFSTTSAFLVPIHHAHRTTQSPGEPSWFPKLALDVSKRPVITKKQSSEGHVPPPIFNITNGKKLTLNQRLHRLTRKRHPQSAQEAHHFLEEALANTTQDNNTVVDEKSFNICIMGFAKQRNDAMAPAQAEALLRQMQEIANKTLIEPSLFTYNAVMEAWSKSKSMPSARTRHAVLRLFEELKQHPTLSPNTYSYNMLLEAYASLDDTLQLFEEMKRLEKLDRKTISILLKALAREGRAEDAQEVLEYAFGRYRNGDQEMKPNTVWYNNVIQAWTRSHSKHAGERADAVLQEMQSLYESDDSSVRPDTYSYNLVMNAHAESGNTARVEELLVELQDRYSLTGEAELEPDTITYSTLIKAYANHPDQSVVNAEHASAILHNMQRLHTAGRTKVKPNLVTYNTVIKIWAQLATQDSLERATQILKQMKRHHLQPDATSYAELIYGWSRSGLRHAGYRAEELLHQLQALPPLRRRGVKLTVLYNAVIKAWAKSGDAKATPGRVDALLDKMEQQYYKNSKSAACPDTTTFLSVCDAYAKSRATDAQERCEGLLHKMDNLLEAGATHIQPSRALYNSMLNALGKSCQEGAAQKAEELVAQMKEAEDPECRPNIVTYASLISCHTKSGEPHDRAEELLEYVEHRYLKDHDDMMKPNPVFYSTVQQSWAKSATSEGADKAERLLRRNLELWKSNGAEYARPHTIVFNAAMDAIARSGDACCGRRAEALLLEMEDLYKSGNECMKPSRRSFSAVMLGYRQDGDADKAEELLQRMEQLAEAGVYDVSPCVVDYNCVIGALADSNDSAATDRAQALLDHMLVMYRKKGNWALRPDEITYSGVIKAWLKRNDEKGRAMAHVLLQDFLDLVEETKAPAETTDAVWKVINEYRKGGHELSESNVDVVLEDMASEFDEIDWSTV